MSVLCIQLILIFGLSGKRDNSVHLFGAFMGIYQSLPTMQTQLII